MEQGLKSAYFREYERYTIEDIKNKLSCTIDKTEELIKKLKEYGIIKVVKDNEKKDSSELNDADFEVVPVLKNNNQIKYVFGYVGVLVAMGFVIKCYPKYFHTETELSDKDIEKELKKVIKVIEKYSRNKDEEIIHLHNDNVENGKVNRLAIMLYLLQDYYEYGLYKNTLDAVETNGGGRIIWNRTINDTYALIKNNKPYYMELKTKKNINDTNDYFTRLHQCVLSECSKELEDYGLFSIFSDYYPVKLSDNKSDDFGDANIINYNIEKELSTQFNTRKRLLLKSIYAYINNKNSDETNFELSAFGTTSFHVIWENICKDILHDKLNSRIKFPFVAECEEDKNARTYKDLIDKPVWEYDSLKISADNTLIPDIIAIEKVNGKDTFTIFDAKYYDINFSNYKIEGQPGIESIVKQYMYYKLYSEKLKSKDETLILNKNNSANCFIIPYQWVDEMKIKGQVSLDFLSNLPPIKILLVKPCLIYNHYLNEEDNNLTCKILDLIYN